MQAAIKGFTYKSKAEFLLSEEYTQSLDELMKEKHQLESGIVEQIKKVKAKEGEKMKVDGEQQFVNMMAEGAKTGMEDLKKRAAKWGAEEDAQALRAAQSMKKEKKTT